MHNNRNSIKFFIIYVGTVGEVSANINKELNWIIIIVHIVIIIMFSYIRPGPGPCGRFWFRIGFETGNPLNVVRDLELGIPPPHPLPAPLPATHRIAY
jgi:hypothetical protein